MIRIKEYQSREFCKNIDCIFQKAIDDNYDSKGIAKKHCQENCTAYHFHQWLKDNDYKIIENRITKKEIEKQKQKCEKCKYYTGGMASLYHCKIYTGLFLDIIPCKHFERKGDKEKDLSEVIK